MIRSFLLKSLPAVAILLFTVLLSSCTVDENATLTTAGSPMGEGKKGKKTEVNTSPASLTWSEKRKADQEQKAAEREEQAAAQAKADAVEAKKLAAAKKVEKAAQQKAAREEEKRLVIEGKRLAAEEKAHAEAEAAEHAAKLAATEAKAKAKTEKAAAAKKFREDAITARELKDEAAKLAKIEAKKKAEEERAARAASHEVSAAARSRRGGGGFFSLLSIGTTPKQYQSEGHDIYVNEMLLPTLHPSNAQIVISLREQRARVYRRDGGAQLLVIDTRISTGKPGYATSSGNYRISEKLVEKQSTLYGTWVNSAGETVNSSGDSRRRPPGASRFVGADMPYWMRINGGIGLHIGYVPDYPASHGCIRVPEAIQPLIYSKVGLGTQVTVSH